MLYCIISYDEFSVCMVSPHTKNSAKKESASPKLREIPRGPRNSTVAGGTLASPCAVLLHRSMTVCLELGSDLPRQAPINSHCVNQAAIGRLRSREAPANPSGSGAPGLHHMTLPSCSA